jgi:hypothetical protein
MIARISFREDVMLDTADAVHFTPTNEPSPSMRRPVRVKTVFSFSFQEVFFV